MAVEACEVDQGQGVTIQVYGYLQIFFALIKCHRGATGACLLMVGIRKHTENANNIVLPHIGYYKALQALRLPDGHSSARE